MPSSVSASASGSAASSGQRASSSAQIRSLLATANLRSGIARPHELDRVHDDANAPHKTLPQIFARGECGADLDSERHAVRELILDYGHGRQHRRPVGCEDLLAVAGLDNAFSHGVILSRARKLRGDPLFDLQFDIAAVTHVFPGPSQQRSVDDSEKLSNVHPDIIPPD